MDDETLEATYAQLRAEAEEIDCDLSLHLTIGGIDITELYRVKLIPDGATDLAGQLNEMAALLDDDRTAAAARAAKLMKGAEILGREIADLIKARQEEYRVAVKAFQSISTDPPVSDDVQDALVGAVSIARDPDLFEVLLDIVEAAKSAKPAKTGGTDATASDDPGT